VSSFADSAQTVVYADLVAAAERLQGNAHLTPVLTSRTIDALTGHQVFFKCENFQRTGSFKFRGAYNALSQLDLQQRQQGVLAFSSGNHAQAMSLAGSLLQISTTILMPEDAPAVKQAATRGYGAEVLLFDRHTTSREALAERLSAERGSILIPPYDHPQVIAGQGTVGKELFEQVGELDLLLVCCGGGGLLSGCAIAASELAPQCQVIGVEPANGDDVTRSFQTKTIQSVHNPDTIADGARTPAPGLVTFPLILQHVQAMLTVTDEQLLRAMILLWERLKIVVEPTGALAAAALLEGLIEQPAARVGVVISGGNLDLRGNLFERFRSLE